MSLDYLANAFKRLDKLNESVFNQKDMNLTELDDMINNPYEAIKVIDDDAISEDDIQDSYAGKVIVQCPVCKSQIYKAKEDIIFDEATNMVNIEDMCPNCGEMDSGFTVVGEVVAMDESKTENSTEPESEEPVDDVTTPAEVTDETAPVVEESLINKSLTEAIIWTKTFDSEDAMNKWIDKNKNKYDFEQSYNENKYEIQYCKKGKRPEFTPNAQPAKVDVDASTDAEKELALVEKKSNLADKFNKKYGKKSNLDESFKIIGDLSDYEPWSDAVSTWEAIQNADKVDALDVYLEEQYPEGLSMTELNDILWFEGESILAHLGIEVDADDTLDESAKGGMSLVDKFNAKYGNVSTIDEGCNKQKPIDEHFNEDNKIYQCIEYWVDTEGLDELQELGLTVTKIGTSGQETKYKFVGPKSAFDKARLLGYFTSVQYDGNAIIPQMYCESTDTLTESVKVETDEKEILIDGATTTITDKTSDNELPAMGDVEDVATSNAQDETIAPLSDETVAQIEANSTDDSPVEETPATDDAEGAGTQDASNENATSDDEPEGDGSDEDLNEIQEESFNKLGTKMLQNIYENVKSFTTTNALINDKHLVLEGYITFASGNKKKTSFKFEAKKLNNNRMRFLGENQHLTSAKRPFAITAKVEGKKLIGESLRYNFVKPAQDGKLTRIHGSVNTQQ